MKKGIISLLGLSTLIVTLTGCGHEHTWTEATCLEARMCSECGKVDGEALGHVWSDANCTEAKICNQCGETDGEALGHVWVEATYDTPKTCSVCSETDGEALSVEANKYCEAGKALLFNKEVDLEQAYENFKKAEELGMIDAKFYLGVLCDWYSYPEEDFEQAKIYYEACGENPYAQISLGFLYQNGQGVEQDKDKAEEIFQAAIDNGCVEGYFGMAWQTYDGDYEMLYEYLSQAITGTEPLYIAEAMTDIGELYLDGNGVETDYTLAMDWYEKAADLGNAKAMNQIAYMYYMGMGVEQDYSLAAEWFEKAANAGNVAATANIGSMYKDGKGVEQNYALAIEWYTKAAELGNVYAMCEFGYMYENGEGVEQDYALAIEWYTKAAELGDDTAMNNLGYIYGAGEGVEQNYALALEWLEKAAALGNTMAAENAEYIRNLMNS